MADATHIEWTDTTWNPVAGCSVVSPGCTNCYAMRMAGRLEAMGVPLYAGLTRPSRGGPVWTGAIAVSDAAITKPLRWRKPRRIFVNSMSDLFHDGVTDDQLDQIFAVMALCPQHTFQILTKRPERMRDYLASGYNEVVHSDVRAHAVWQAAFTVNRAAKRPDARFTDALRAQGCAPSNDRPWPLPNVWLGVSVEDQIRADERIPVLLDTPAAVRWISAEPVLGAVDLTSIRRFADGMACKEYIDALRGTYWTEQSGLPNPDPRWAKPGVPFNLDYDHCGGLDWVIVGGESGPGARPMHPDWARQLRDQCAAADVPFLFKQWGAWAPRDEWRPGVKAPAMVAVAADGGRVPDDVAPQDVGGHRMALIGKKAAGRHLDGVLHDGFPGVRS